MQLTVKHTVKIQNIRYNMKETATDTSRYNIKESAIDIYE